MAQNATYNSIDEALANIADRSFCESATITPKDGQFVVEDSQGGEEVLYWNHTDGVDYSEVRNMIDHSRLHEAYESYAEARHISYNLPAAIAALESGEAVLFNYSIVDADSCDDDSDCIEGECSCDRTAGWVLYATKP